MVGELVAQGQAAGEFGPGDPALLGKRTMDACAGVLHPTLIAKCSADDNIDANAQGVVAFALRALANKNPPAGPVEFGVSVMQARLLIFALLPALLLAACNAPTQAKKETPQRPVLVAQVHYAPRVQQRVLPGIVKARIESDLAFRVPGKIAERFVDAGAIVKKGDALARLDDTDFRLQVDQAEADYSSAKGALAQTQAEEERIGTLKTQGWSAAADVDKTKSAADQARGAFARAERAVTLARNAVTYTTLTADADGIVSAVLAEPGQVLAAGAAVDAARPIPASGRRRSPFPRRWSIASARRPRASNSGLCPASRWRRPCANCRPTPIRRRAPIWRATASPTRRPTCIWA